MDFVYRTRFTDRFGVRVRAEQHAVIQKGEMTSRAKSSIASSAQEATAMNVNTMLSECAQRRDDELMALQAILAPDEISMVERSADALAKALTRKAEKEDSLFPISPRESVALSVPIVLPRPSCVRIRTHVYSIYRTAFPSHSKHGLQDVTLQLDELHNAVDKIHLNPEGKDRASSAKSSSKQRQAGQKNASRANSGEPKISRLTTSTDRAKETLHHAYHVEDVDLCEITYLPAVRLLLHLPPEYPEQKPPHIAHIAFEHTGRTRYEDGIRQDEVPQDTLTAVHTNSAAIRARVASWLRRTLEHLWEEMPSEILYWWYETLRDSAWSDVEGPCFDHEHNCLILEECVVRYSFDGHEGQGRQASSERLSTLIRTHDMLRKRKEFEGERFGCGICLEEKRGGKCFRLAGCGHVFCQDCLSSYLSTMIREGYLRQAKACPDPECVKMRVATESAVTNVPSNDEGSDKNVVQDGSITTNVNDEGSDKNVVQDGSITTNELLTFVGKELVARLHDLEEKASASIDPTAGFCPRPGCQRLVRADPKDAGTAYEAMRQCVCGFTYCLYCGKAWHGRNPCNILSSSALIEEYQRCAAGSMERRTMELKYGRANLERMVRTHEEEQSNRAWIESNTQECPCCHVFITKSFGCNHMSCKSCNTHFCYRCGTRLPPNEPYRHFNTPGAPCYMKLFDSDMTAPGAAGDWEELDEGEVARWEAENL